MPVQTLDDRTKTDRNVCLTLATNIRNCLNENRATMQDYIHYYNITEQRLSYLNDYAQKRYNDIQTSISKMAVTVISISLKTGDDSGR